MIKLYYSNFIILFYEEIYGNENLHSEEQEILDGKVILLIYIFFFRRVLNSLIIRYYIIMEHIIYFTFRII
jgi:hypothetical protein